jgi:hypothetical protein
MLEGKSTKFCFKCGVDIDIKDKICPKCEAEQPFIPEKISNWWYVFSFFLGIIGGVLAWAINKDRNPKKAIRFLIIGFVVPAIISIGVFGVTFYKLWKWEENDSNIMAAMLQLQSAIEHYYVDNIERGYSGVNCFLTELSSICSKIKEYTGSMPTIKSSTKNYCAYAQLPTMGYYYCFSDTNPRSITNVFPGKSGYCDGITFSCPRSILENF